MNELSHSSLDFDDNDFIMYHSYHFVFQGDLGCYLQKKGRLSPSKALRFALDIARQVLFFSYHNFSIYNSYDATISLYHRSY